MKVKELFLQTLCLKFNQNISLRFFENSFEEVIGIKVSFIYILLNE